MSCQSAGQEETTKQGVGNDFLAAHRSLSFRGIR
jgi:hypothetical protein